jgi:Uma2 family endonuclease
MADAAQLKDRPYDVAAFRAFLDTRPDDERWELIEGVAVQSAAPRLVHQRIASNFERHLNAALRRLRPAWRADREVGIEVSDTSRYRPEPEVTVIDALTDTERTFADRFYLVMEVPRASDRGRILASKLGFYRTHPHNRFIVIADQERPAVTLHVRNAAGAWASMILTVPDDALVLGDLGLICTLADIYADTHLDPRRWP